ncbi:MAG TPA: hypothetical protein DIW64_16140 [Cellvibrio sp.]|nr:hypothetical protein [Cellvibrio sp.]
MNKYYAQWGADFIVFAVVESPGVIAGANVAECSGYGVVGKKRSGGKFVDVPKIKQYKVWSKPEFIMLLGQQVYEAINSTADKQLQFFKYILDSAPHVDMNDANYRGMVQQLRVVNLIDDAKLAALLVQE